MRKRKALGLSALALFAVLIAGCGSDVSSSPAASCDPACTDGKVCKDGQCVDDVPAGECDPACIDGKVCKDGQCVDEKTAGECDPACIDGKVCKDGQCVDETSAGECDPACIDGKVCKDGQCVDEKPAGECDPACIDGKVCKDGQCVEASAAPCGGKCTDSQTCNETTGECEDKTITCPENQMLCGSDCIDLKNDPAHCGSCENACADGKICVDSKCEYVCEGSAPDKCEDGCYNFQTDVEHCGDCAIKCGDGKVCNEGKCGLSCSSGETFCDDSCVNTQSDNMHCGSCDKSCDTVHNESCQGGVCVKTCPSGQELCDDDCVELDLDSSCGSCDAHPACDTAHDMHCSSNRVCEVACADEADPSQLVFVNLMTDPTHCGSCNGDKHICGDKEVCSEGKCVSNCANDEVAYDGACIKKNDPTHCGLGYEGGAEIPEGGIDCTSLEGVLEATCEEGACKIAKCDDNYAVCDADPHVCTDLRKPEHCGSCQNECKDANAIPEKTTCRVDEKEPEKMVCHFECKEGMTSCGGVCKNLAEDNDNCGWCGNKCNGDAKCQGGFCVIDKACDNEGYLATTVDGQEIKAYCIGTETKFREMRDMINQGKAYPDAKNVDNAYIITDELILGNEFKWVPIGTRANPFNNGIFLGNGQKISGKLTTSARPNGLFGTVSSSIIDGMNVDIELSTDQPEAGCLIGNSASSTIRYSKVEGSLTSTGNVYKQGLLVGYSSKSDISHCRVSGKMVSTAPANIAGLVGIIAAGTKVDYCEADVDIKVDATTSAVPADYSVWAEGYGGLIGASHGGESVVSNSSSSGKIDIFIKNVYWGGIGGLMGWMETGVTTIKDCHSSVEVVSTAQHSGGLVGLIRYNGTGTNTILDSYATGKVTCPFECGGFLGSAWSYGGTDMVLKRPVIIKNVYATGDVVATRTSEDAKAGGLIGFADYINLDHAYATGNVTGSAIHVGGLIGYVMRNSKIDNVWASGKVTGMSYTGGLIGYAGASAIKNAHASATVTGNSSKDNYASYIGGLIGQADGGTYDEVYATGDVTGFNYVGGLIGELRTSGAVNNAFSSGEVSAQKFGTTNGSNIGGLIGLMYTSASMSNAVSVNDVKGGANVGAVVGGTDSANNSPAYSLRYVYGTGKISGTDKVGAFIGEAKYGEKITIKNSYYWEESHSAIIGSSLVSDALYPFKYKAGTAVLSVNEKRKLVDSLSSDWISASCTLKSGPQGTVSIPVPKALGADVCK